MSDPVRAKFVLSSTVQIDRRRMLSSIAGGALLVGLHTSSSLAQPATPTAEHVAALSTLSHTLCGGGVFDAGQTAQLASLIASDATLASGLEELQRDSAATPSPGARSTEAQATAQAILLYWYTGQFKGEPIANHAAVYTQLQAWQAMYTPAWTTCKAYGAWADPPTMTPQQPENA